MTPNSPTNNTRYKLMITEDLAWFNHDIKLSNQKLFGFKELGFTGGYHFDEYKMKL